MEIRTKVWIDDGKGNVIFGSGREHMLEAIDRLGSMNKAARELRMSYRALWGRIKSTEERLGAEVLVRKAGGGKGSGSALTPAGKDFLKKYQRLKECVVKVADQEFAKLFS